MRLTYTSMGDHGLDELAVASFVAREPLEVEAAMLVLHDPKHGYRVARALGLRPEHFALRDDLRHLWRACERCTGKSHALLSARCRLKSAGCWSAEPVWRDRGRWGARKLLAFALAFAPFTSDRTRRMQARALRLVVPRLVRLHRRQVVAQRSLARARRALSSDVVRRAG